MASFRQRASHARELALGDVAFGPLACKHLGVARGRGHNSNGDARKSRRFSRISYGTSCAVAVVPERLRRWSFGDEDIGHCATFLRLSVVEKSEVKPSWRRDSFLHFSLSSSSKSNLASFVRLRLSYTRATRTFLVGNVKSEEFRPCLQYPRNGTAKHYPHNSISHST